MIKPPISIVICSTSDRFNICIVIINEKLFSQCILAQYSPLFITFITKTRRERRQTAQIKFELVLVKKDNSSADFLFKRILIGLLSFFQQCIWVLFVSNHILLISSEFVVNNHFTHGRRISDCKFSLLTLI